ncbi:MAG TPA: PfkB family carbohydrate kinase [Vicinamibacterales bacterium]|nr:PfkB family carbohydrate kinase [Vicinamibacterales bacterium]
MRLPIQVPDRANHAFDVVGLGLNSIDLVTVVAEFPVSDSKQRLQRFARLPGGQIATAMSVCARLGWTARYLGTFGDDDFGRLSKESLEREGVDLAESRTIAGATNQFAVVLVDASTGARTVLWDRHPGLAIDPASVSRHAVQSGRMLIVDCHETAAATAAARYAREAGIPTIVDVERVRPGIADLLQHIDAIVAAERFPAELTGCGEQGRALEMIAREFNAPIVCVTLGAEGTLTRCGGREIRTPGFIVDCVDSTGAGDAFRGGFAAACLRDPDGSLEDALLYANAVAALNCRGLGARGGMPSADEVEHLLYARF